MGVSVCEPAAVPCVVCVRVYANRTDDVAYDGADGVLRVLARLLIRRLLLHQRLDEAIGRDGAGLGAKVEAPPLHGTVVLQHLGDVVLALLLDLRGGDEIHT